MTHFFEEIADIYIFRIVAVPPEQLYADSWSGSSSQNNQKSIFLSNDRGDVIQYKGNHENQAEHEIRNIAREQARAREHKKEYLRMNKKEV